MDRDEVKALIMAAFLSVEGARRIYRVYGIVQPSVMAATTAGRLRDFEAALRERRAQPLDLSRHDEEDDHDDDRCRLRVT